MRWAMLQGINFLLALQLQIVQQTATGMAAEILVKRRSRARLQRTARTVRLKC